MNALSRMVAEYVRLHRPRLESILQRMNECRNIADALKLAVTYEDPDTGSLHSHQRRIGRKKLSRCETALREALVDLPSATGFDQVYARVNHVISGMPGIGPLTVYDISLRIGAFLKLYPQTVYLHTGALEGARKFGFVPVNGQLQKSVLTRELQQLEPYEIENFFCIYKRGAASSCGPVKRMCSA